MAGPGDALFLALAQAKAQPDRWARDLNAGVGAVKDTAGGYMQGLQMRRQMQEYPLDIAGKKAALYTNFSNLAKEVGPDRASQIFSPVFKGTGIDLPTSNMPTGQETPDQLINEGEYGKNKLSSMNEAQGLSEKGPRDPVSVRSNLITSGLDPKAADTWLSANTDPQTGKIQNKNYEDFIKGLTAKNQGNRIDMMGGMVNLRGANAIMSALPSHQPPGSPAGAASGVQLAVRQGKGLIANPLTDPKRIGLASLDTARAVLRAAPQLDAINGANYADTLSNTLNNLGNRFSSGQMKPEDIPVARKQIYDALTDLENTSRPLIARELAQTERTYGPQGFLPPNWEDMKKSEMGLDLPDIPFNPGTGSAQNPNVSTGIPQVGGTFQGGKVLHVEKLSQ